MTDRKLRMPGHVSDLVHMCLTRMGLDPFRGDDMITCPVMYEDGTELSIVFMCVPKRRWFREDTVLLVSLVQLDRDNGPVVVHVKKTIDCPSGPHDLQFVMTIPRLVRLIAWSHGIRADTGECVSLPGPNR